MFRWAWIGSIPIVVGACGTSGKPVVGSDEKGIPANKILFDDHALIAGREVNTRDLQYRIEDLRHRLATGNPRDPKRPKMEATIAFIESARKANPQCLRFVTVVENERVRLEPLDRMDFPVPNRNVSFDVAIVGGEIESITTAMAFARRGKMVALIYAGSLGGLCSDSGGNLRFFDGYGGIPRPEEQQEVFRKAFGMGDFVSLPSDLDRRIRRFLESEYGGRINMYRAESYESLRVVRMKDRIEAIDVPGVVRVRADVFVDAEPESRVAEKAGLEFDALTPNLAYGLVFDVPGFTRRHIESLFKNPRLSPEAIARFAGVSLGASDESYFAKTALAKLREDLRSDFARDRGNYWLGFKAAASGFDFYMKLKGVGSEDASIAFLNRTRRTSGFNIALSGGVGNFNSISYTFGFTLLQHAHSISEDERLRPILEIEIHELEKYLRYVTNDENLTIRIPDQFYVRKSTAHFKTKRPYQKDDFVRSRPENARWWMMYPMDYRNISPRNAREREQASRLYWSGTEVYWRCRSDVCDTEIVNLYLLNKSLLTPEYSGATRILQNFITTGVALAERLSR